MERHNKSIEYAMNILLGETYQTQIKAIYVYGSCARGTAKFDNNVDLLIQCEKEIPTTVVRSMRIDAMPDDYNIPEVVLKFVYGDKWKSGEDTCSRNLCKDGVWLWENKEASECNRQGN